LTCVVDPVGRAYPVGRQRVGDGGEDPAIVQKTSVKSYVDAGDQAGIIDPDRVDSLGTRRRIVNGGEDPATVQELVRCSACIDIGAE
jgi:hypothetical protein